MTKEVTLLLGPSFDLIIRARKPIEEPEILRFLQKNPKKELEYRAKPVNYPELKLLFNTFKYKQSTNFLQEPLLSKTYSQLLKFVLKLRDYQKEALYHFKANKYRGVVVLPTAAGKTIIALKSIAELKQKTLVLVPTVNLLYQWKENISKYLHLPKVLIGQVGDKVKEVKEITVTTYDSARLNLNTLRKTFNFLIADECHHSVAEETTKVLEGFPAEYRLGLTATPERSDERDKLLDKLIGPQIIVTKVAELAKKGYVANYRLETIYVPLEADERYRYEEYMNIYTSYLKKNNIRLRRGLDFERFLVFRVNKDPEAREALDAHRKARQLVFSSKAKLKVLEELLSQHKDDQVIIFSEFNDIVYEISKKYLIPAITHEIKTKEREDILKKFSKGEYSKLVTGKVLDEGWDCGTVSVGVIVSGTGQSRQFIQRLGRILRPKEKEVVLYELVTKQTLETKTVKRRKKTEVI